MTDRCYNVHGLIDVRVDPRVAPSVLSAIEFQIGYFQGRAGGRLMPCRVSVKPYCRFCPDPDAVFEEFHTLRAVPGRCLDHRERQFAVVRETDGFSIFTDTAFVISPYLQLLLMDQGISYVHAAAVADGAGRVLLFPGPGGVGKTALLGFLIREHGYRLLGDDNVGLSEAGRCLAIPRAFIIKEYHRSVYPEIFERRGLDAGPDRMKAAVYGLIGFAGANAPFVGMAKSVLRRLGVLDRVAHRLAPPWKPDFLAAVPVEEIFGPDRVADEGPLDRVIFLQRYSGTRFRLDSVDEETLARRMNAIIHHEWVDLMRPFFAMGALGLVDVSRHFGRVQEILRKGIGGRPCFLLSIPDRAAPEALRDFVYSAVIRS